MVMYRSARSYSPFSPLFTRDFTLLFLCCINELHPNSEKSEMFSTVGPRRKNNNELNKNNRYIGSPHFSFHLSLREEGKCEITGS